MTRHPSCSFALCGGLALAVLAASGLVPGLAGLAHAQDATTGAIVGRVVDAKTKEPLGGVTIVTGQGSAAQTVISEDDGTYRITGLVPGEYLITFFYGESTVHRKGVRVSAAKSTSVHQAIEVEGEEVYLEDDGPVVEPSTEQHTTFDRRYLAKMPVPGTTFESALGGTPGTQNDGHGGVAVSGSTSAENRYVVDGVDTTSLRYGSVGSPVINAFIEEIDVITGGYNAEYGRATGGVVNVVTRTGSNDLEGTIFAYARPGALTLARERTPTEASSIDARADLDVDSNGGAVVSGPIVKDKLWFVIGAAPSYTRSTITRTTRRRTDCRQLLPSGAMSECDPRPFTSGGHADGVADTDPATGFHIFDELASSRRHPTTMGANLLGKLNYAYSPEQQGQLTVTAIPTRNRSYGVYGLPSTTDFDANGMTSDVSARWTSKLNDNKTELEAVLGWHRDRFEARNRDAAARTLPLEILYFGNLGDWSQLPGSAEAPATAAGCSDAPGSGDLYPLITNCPDEGVGYRVGGGGSFTDDTEDRHAAKLALVQRVKAAGTHEIKAGADVEDNRLDQARAYTGGAFYENYLDADTVLANLWVQVGPDGTSDPRFDRMCKYTPEGATTAEDLPCRYIGQSGEGSRIAGETVNWAAYLRDSWQVRPNLTLNYGVRYEEQRLRFADYLRDEIDPVTNRPYGTNAMTLANMWAPRVGLLYDWTRVGRSKVYAHLGRFYESIPMDINARSFAGEVNYQLSFQAHDANGMSRCGPTRPGYGGPSGTGCNLDRPDATDLIGINGSLVAPGIKPQYMDEGIAGVEYEVMDDLKLAVAYQQRRLGRVIEDVSTDGALTYIIANPGEWDPDEQHDLEARIMATSDPAERRRLEGLLAQFEGVRLFDKPSRNYHALQFTATRRFSNALFVQGSYTYSRTTGNFPGLISYDNGQVDPNISSQYDLIELLANRQGPLPQDRPHYIKLDGYYSFDLRRAGELTVGARVRALSGVPRNALGRHPRYGIGESFLLPRGQIARTGFEQSLDLHVGFARKLAHGMELEVYADVFNVLDDQGTAGVDDNYTYLSAANPIVGGTFEDLVFAKENVLAGTGRGAETSVPIKRNPNFGNTTTRYSPLSAQLGARLNF